MTPELLEEFVVNSQIIRCDALAVAKGGALSGAAYFVQTLTPGSLPEGLKPDLASQEASHLSPHGGLEPDIEDPLCKNQAEELAPPFQGLRRMGKEGNPFGWRPPIRRLGRETSGLTIPFLLGVPRDEGGRRPAHLPLWITRIEGFLCRLRISED